MRLQRNDMIGASVALVSVLGFWQLNRSTLRPARYNSACQSNLKQIGLGLMQYMRDYDERAPRAANWMPALQPYLKRETIYNCPARADWQFGYAMNARFAQVSFSQFEGDYANATVIYDSDLNRLNAVDNGDSLPKPFRHRGGNNLLFADGHVKLSARANFNFPLGPTPTPYFTPTPRAKPNQPRAKAKAR